MLFYFLQVSKTALGLPIQLLLQLLVTIYMVSKVVINLLMRPANCNSRVSYTYILVGKLSVLLTTKRKAELVADQSNSLLVTCIKPSTHSRLLPLFVRGARSLHWSCLCISAYLCFGRDSRDAK